ncbi:amino acid transporter AVT6B-like [Vicia villosa]|uniref:amino acid transporter AVT6B-like n=1 Tax=Vicia villosa TaxID=3911 RepID=UPI00273CA40A|nr:amino acid transporter AVT6B-like [Vicia villosa]
MSLPFTDRKRRNPKPHHQNPVPDTKRDDVEGGFDGSSFTGAVFNLSTTIVGAGIMALPAAVKQLGLIPGLIMIVLCAMITESSIVILLRFTHASKSSTYSGVVRDGYGDVGRFFLLLCIIFNNMGMLVVYMVIIGDVFSGTWSQGVHYSGVLDEWFGQRFWSTRPILLFLTTIFVFIPLASFRRVDSLRYTSALSVGLAIVFVVITAGLAIVKFFYGSIGMPRLMPKLTNDESFWKLFTTIPILVTAYICHHNVHPIENELKDTSHMNAIVRTSLILCTCVYMATSLFGILLFGDKIQDDVLANFDGDLGVPYGTFLNDVVRVSYGIHLILVFPIVFFSLRLNLDGLLFPHAIPLAFDNKRFYFVTLILMAFVFVGANYVPSIWYAFQFTGATTTLFVGYIFPAAIALKDNRGVATKKDKLLSLLIIILAVSCSTIAICSDLYTFNNKTTLHVA